MSDVSFYLDALKTHRNAGKPDSEFKHRINRLYLVGMLDESTLNSLSAELGEVGEPDKASTGPTRGFPSRLDVTRSRVKATPPAPPQATYSASGGCEGDGGCSGPPKSRKTPPQDNSRCGNHSDNSRCGNSSNSNGRC